MSSGCILIPMHPCHPEPIFVIPTHLCHPDEGGICDRSRNNFKQRIYIHQWVVLLGSLLCQPLRWFVPHHDKNAACHPDASSSRCILIPMHPHPDASLSSRTHLCHPDA